MSFNSRKFKDASREGLEIGEDITPSVIVLARLGKVNPKAFAEALADEEGNSLYRADLITALQRVCVKTAVAEAAKDAVTSLKKVLGIGNKGK